MNEHLLVMAQARLHSHIHTLHNICQWAQTSGAWDGVSKAIYSKEVDWFELNKVNMWKDK